MSKKQKHMLMTLKKMSKADGYLEAHRDVKESVELLGGPISFTVRQETGGVRVALPDNRDLDSDVRCPRGFCGRLYDSTAEFQLRSGGAA